MVNTVNQTLIVKNSRRVVNYLTLVSDGSEETTLVVYDSSVICAAVGIPDQLNAMIERVWFSGSKPAGAATVNLLYDASTDVLALPINFAAAGDAHFESDYSFFGGLKNYAGSGKTGDILLTTTGLDTGDAFTLVLDIRVG